MQYTSSRIPLSTRPPAPKRPLNQTQAKNISPQQSCVQPASWRACWPLQVGTRRVLCCVLRRGAAGARHPAPRRSPQHSHGPPEPTSAALPGLAPCQHEIGHPCNKPAQARPQLAAASCLLAERQVGGGAHPCCPGRRLCTLHGCLPAPATCILITAVHDRCRTVRPRPCTSPPARMLRGPQHYLCLLRMHAHPADTIQPSLAPPPCAADQRWDPHNVDSSGVSGNMAKYTVPGTDVFVVNTGER